MTTSLDALSVDTIRFLSADGVEKANSGHPGTAMALAPLAYVLWTKFLKHNPNHHQWADRDRFILSAGHASMLIYSMLYLTGYDLSLDDLKNFRQWESRTPGHPEYGHTPGIETTTGPLGQGFGTAIGMAIAEKHLSAHFNRSSFRIVDHHTYVIASDGDLMEGVSHEAASLAGHLGLGKLITFYDDNKITIDGHTDLAFSEDVEKRFEAYGWHVQIIRNGDEDLEGIANAIKEAQKEQGKPSLIIVKTTIAYGCPNKENTHGAHGSPLGEDEIQLCKRKLNWPSQNSFYIPEDALKVFRACIKKGEKSEANWNFLFRKYSTQYPLLAAEWSRRESKNLSFGWKKNLPYFKSTDNPIATRSASGKVLNAIAPSLQELVGGSADTHSSTNTYLKDFGSFSKNNPKARNFHFGVREHAMGTVLNGLALHGCLIPLGSTFLVFSDYMKPAIRLASLMKIRSIFVFTHDSIGVGEDGPTHQPIEHIASLRVIPGLVVLRPADANETRGAWRVALERKEGPTAIILSRQDLPVLERSDTSPDENVRRGGYVLAETKSKEKLDVIFLATGSEVALALEAKTALEKEDFCVRVVSIPSWELFRSQEEHYKKAVIPSDVKARISIEAAAPQGWREFLGNDGVCIGLERFGVSAPGKVVMDKLGFNVNHITDCAKKLIKRYNRDQ